MLAEYRGKKRLVSSGLLHGLCLFTFKVQVPHLKQGIVSKLLTRPILISIGAG